MFRLIKERVLYYFNSPIYSGLRAQTDELKLQNGRILCFVQPDEIASLNDAEFQVYSQWGEDGIIQWLIKHIPITNKTFIEFGVEDYEQSNTRFLLMNNNWSGMIIDGSEEAIEHVKNTGWYWKYDLYAVCAFITKENINPLLRQSGFDEDLGILSIDVDGNDYWILHNIEYYKPRILICEYNAVFGYDKAVTIPYEENFYRTEAHFSNLYWGASLMAMKKEAEDRGYTLVGINSNANNAFFVRNDLVKYIRFDISSIEMPIQKYRESRNSDGSLSMVSGIANKQYIIKDMPLIDIENNMLQICVGDL